MNTWATAESGRLYVNVSGGHFEVYYKPIATQGKVYINVSGTGI